MGEGEATFLLPPEQATIEAVARRLEYYFGHCDVSLAQWTALCAALRQSVIHADVLCPPEPGQWRFRSRADDGFAPRYRQLAECLGALEFPEMPLMSEAYVNYALHADGTLFELLEAEEEIGLISSQPAAPLLQTLFGLRVREYAVPQRAVDNESLADTGHFPGRFTELCAILRREVKGLLVLVGAGPLGKIYCEVIRQAGGIALDVGSLLDAWTGLCSRADHTSLHGCKAPGVPGFFPEGVHEDLLLTPQTVTRLTGRPPEQVAFTAAAGQEPHVAVFYPQIRTGQRVSASAPNKRPVRRKLVSGALRPGASGGHPAAGTLFALRREPRVLAQSAF